MVMVEILLRKDEYDKLCQLRAKEKDGVKSNEILDKIGEIIIDNVKAKNFKDAAKNESPFIRGRMGR